MITSYIYQQNRGYRQIHPGWTETLKGKLLLRVVPQGDPGALSLWSTHEKNGKPGVLWSTLLREEFKN